MIISTPPNHRFTAAGGLVLALGVTGLGLVRAGTDPVPDAGVRAASPGDRVGVERQAPLPDWRVEIDAKLARRLETVVFAKTDLVAALHAAGEMLDIRMRVNDEAIYDSGEPLIDLEVTGASGAELLDLLCLFGSDLYWSIANGTVHVGYGGDLPSSVDLRFYRVAPILESRGLEDPDELISYVQEFGLGEGADHRLQGDFEQQGWSIEMWRGLLAVRATEDGHRSIHTALDRALNAQSLPAPANEPWRAGIEAALAQKLNFQWEDMEASAALMQLSEVIGVPVLHPFEDVDDYGNTFSFNLENVPVQYVLDVVAELQGRRVHIADGAVLLAESYDLETRFYSIEQLLKHADGSERDLVDEVCEFVTGVDSESWDMDPRCVVTRLGDQLVIQQAAKNHEQIAALLAQMERALGGG